MPLHWVTLYNGDAGDSSPEDVAAARLRELAAVARNGAGRAGGLHITIQVLRNGSGGAMYRISNPSVPDDSTVCLLCWTAETADTWWSRAVDTQRSFLRPEEALASELPPQAPRSPWLALCEPAVRLGLTSEQPDIELATAWVVLALRSGLDDADVRRVMAIIGADA